ncbi:hypothetical protein PSTT_17015 [Puccinia striiformis]|uniref:Uncharacterized protein n=1 Tax=Puccinia striiformis TaxID=27350 RepID=A0A2S4UA06_9BASI|nr:hypothetical protein PSTT_17015 [Puccinia striiformis]
MADWDEFHPDKPDTNDQGATTLERLGASNTNQVDQESPSQEETIIHPIMTTILPRLRRRDCRTAHSTGTRSPNSSDH